MRIFSVLPLLTGCLIGDDGSLPIHAHAASTSPLYGLNVSADGTGSATVSDLGASWVRLELVDGLTDQLGATVDDYHARGVSVLLLVDYASLDGNAGFGNGAPCGDWDGYRAAWLARVGSIAQQYGDKVDAWEIWNEPDQPMLACGDDGYNPGMPASAYGPLLRDADQTIRSAGAVGPVVTAGLDSGQVSYIVDAANAAGGLYADGVSIHPYGVVPDASWCPDPGEDLNCDWGTLGGKVDDYSSATGLPVWITELGIRTTDTAHEADYIAGAYAAFASHGAAHAFWFCESDAMVAPYGLTYSDGSAKPDAYAQYQALAGGAGESDPHTPMLHGTIALDGAGVEGLVVTAWGQSSGDFHETTTDALGIYQFTDLDEASLYNIVVNASFDNGGYDAIDTDFAYDVRNNVELVSGPDGWHGEDFSLAY